MAHNKPNRTRSTDGHAYKQDDVTETRLDTYRMETTSVGMISAEDDGEFYMGLISDEAKEGLKKWRERKKADEGA